MWMLKHKQKSVHNKSKKWKKTSTDHRSARIWVVDQLRFSLFFLQWFQFGLIGKVKQFFFVRNLQVRPPPPLPLPFDVIEIGLAFVVVFFSKYLHSSKSIKLVRCVCDCWPTLPPYRRSAAENQQWISRHLTIIFNSNWFSQPSEFLHSTFS